MRPLVIDRALTKHTATLDRYLNEVSHIPLLPVEHEMILGEQIRNGDRAALDLLVKSNLRFVVSVAKKYQNQGMTLEDLINEGNLGLIKAAHRFDATRGFKFISFAVWWIRQSIIVAVADKRRTVRLPANQINAILKVALITEQLEQQLEREPTTAEISKQMEVAEETVKDYLSHSGWAVSLDKEIDAEKGGTLLDVFADATALAPDHFMMSTSLTSVVQDALTVLNDREKRIIELAFGIGCEVALELEDIAKLFNLSKERVRQLKYDALKTLRRKINPAFFY